MVFLVSCYQRGVVGELGRPPLCLSGAAVEEQEGPAAVIKSRLERFLL